MPRPHSGRGICASAHIFFSTPKEQQISKNDYLNTHTDTGLQQIRKNDYFNQPKMTGVQI